MKRARKRKMTSRKEKRELGQRWNNGKGPKRGGVQAGSEKGDGVKGENNREMAKKGKIKSREEKRETRLE